MMLPTNSAQHLDLPVVIAVLGANKAVLAQLEQLAPPNVEVVELSNEQISAGGVLCLDAVIGILDGNLGVSPEFITAWTELADHNLPRIVLAQNTVTGRADFDEAIALSELVLNEDIAMRFYPIEDEDEPKYVGLLDVLSHEILQPGKQAIPADQEHVNLTVDEHEELVDLLAHADLSDGVFESHSAGMPVSLPRLRNIWDHAELVTVLPIDQRISDPQIVNWMHHRQARWIPTVLKDGIGISPSEISAGVGIGIAPGLARLWNFESATTLELVTESNEILELIEQPAKPIFSDDRIRIGDTVRPRSTDLLVIAPSF